MVIRAGFGLVAIAVATLIGDGAYAFLDALLFSDEIPIPVRAAIVTGGLGVIILLLAVIRERIQERRTEDLDEVEP